MESESLKTCSFVPNSIEQYDVHDTTSDLHPVAHMGQKSEKDVEVEEEKGKAAVKGGPKMVDKGFQFPDLEVTHLDKVTPDLKKKPCPRALFIDGSWMVPDSDDPYEFSSSSDSDDLPYDPADHWTPKFREEFDEIIRSFLPAWNPSMRRKRRRSEN